MKTGLDPDQWGTGWLVIQGAINKADQDDWEALM